MQHAKHLKDLTFHDDDLSEVDKPNVADLATKIIEEQEETNMEKLRLRGLACNSIDEPSLEEKQLIYAVVRSGLNQLIDLDLRENPSWFLHKDT